MSSMHAACSKQHEQKAWQPTLNPVIIVIAPAIQVALPLGCRCRGAALLDKEKQAAGGQAAISRHMCPGGLHPLGCSACMAANGS